jgi:hypothetical protein
MTTFFSRGLVLAPVFLLAAAASILDAELTQKTIDGFNRYVRETERRLDERDQPFLYVDRFPADRKKKALGQLQAGEMVIEKLEMTEGKREIKIDDGLVHHWVGIGFVKGSTVSQAVALLQDYDRHQDVYKPNVARSRTLSRDGDRFRVFLRFHMEKGLTAVVNSDHEAVFTRDASDRASSRIRSTRIQEVTEPNTSEETLRPVGKDRGFLWRLNSYWRFQERDGGVYIQCESVTLTRKIPWGFDFLVGGFVKTIPKDTLEFTLKNTRTELNKRGGLSAAGPRPAEARPDAPRRTQ